MKIIDAQIHIWTQTVVPPSGLHRKVSKFTAEEALREMDEAGVDAALIHPPYSWDPTSNQLAIDAAKKYPDRFAVMGQFPLDDPQSRQRIHGWRNQAGLFLPTFRKIAEAHPRLKLIIDHCGLLRLEKDAAAFGNLDELCALAKLPNVAVKATGAPGYSTHPYPFKNLDDGLQRIFDAYGPKRFFWGTDITRMPCTWRQCVTLFTEELPWLKGQDLEKVMGRGLAKWIGWNYRLD